MRARVIGIWLFSLLCGAACQRSHRPAPVSSEPSPSATKSTAPSSPNVLLEEIERENLEAELALSPSLAFSLGLRRDEDRLDDLRSESQMRESARLRALAARVRAMDPTTLDEPHRLGRRLLLWRVDGALFDLVELRPLERNPVSYLQAINAGIDPFVSDLLTAERLRLLTARLWKVGPLLGEARRNLRSTTPELAVKRAVELSQTTQAFVAETLPKLVATSDAKQLEDFRSGSADAQRALEDFATWLKRDLLPRAHGEAALGRDRLAERIRLWTGEKISPDHLLVCAERALERARNRSDESARLLVQTRPGTDPMKLVEEDQDRPEELEVAVQLALAALTDFASDHHLVAAVRPRVTTLPPGRWGLMQVNASGPLDAHPREPTVLVDSLEIPIDENMTEKRRRQLQLEATRVINRSMIQLTLLHDVLGHLVVEEANRRAPGLGEKTFLSPLSEEGFAAAMEAVVLDAGYAAGDRKLRYLAARNDLLRAVRLVVTLRLHAFSAKVDDAIKVMMEQALVDEQQARFEVERSLRDPFAGMEALGELIVETLRRDYLAAHPGASLEEFHRLLLAHGSIVPQEIRHLLLAHDSGELIAEDL